MQRAYVPLKRAIAGAVTIAAAFAIAGLPTSAQTTTTSPSASTATPRKVPRTATPEMISDAIERSKSRSDRFKATGMPEQFGSEDPTRFRTK